MSAPARVVPFGSSQEHLRAELERIDFYIQAQVRRARRAQHHDDFQGLYISDQEVDDLLARRPGFPRWASEHADVPVRLLLEAAAESARVDRNSRRRKRPCRHSSSPAGACSPVPTECFERDAVLLCLAAEIDIRYEKLYAYLQYI